MRILKWKVTKDPPRGNEEREKEEGTSTFAGRQKEVTNYFSNRKELFQ